MSSEQYQRCRATMFKKGDVPTDRMEVGEYTHTTRQRGELGTEPEPVEIRESRMHEGRGYGG